jgi:lysozyme family protein
MESNFKRSLALVLLSEGGNTDNPADHGGRTSRGITQTEYNAWCREHGKPQIDVFLAPDTDIEFIYHSEYWLSWCPVFPIGVDYLYFDMAVNGGPYRAAILLQRALGVIADGRIGPITRRAVQTTDPISLISRYSDAKRAFYLSLHQPAFTRGWLNRVVAVKANALRMVQQEQTK